jgi:hypothetical protein
LGEAGTVIAYCRKEHYEYETKKAAHPILRPQNRSS